VKDINVRLASFDNSWYSPGAKIKILLWFFINALLLKNPLNPFSSLKIMFLRAFGATIGFNVVIKPCVNIKYPWMLKIGDNVWIGEDVWIDNLAKVEIGNDVCISQGAMLLCGNHNYKKTSFDLEIGNIIVDDGVWIGAKSVVCPGVHCESHSVLAVGSVASANLERYTIYRGNPALKVRERHFV